MKGTDFTVFARAGEPAVSAAAPAEQNVFGVINLAG